MTDVFVSYSREDSRFVRELHSSLTDAGRDVWVDWEDIPAASEWERDIDDSIDGAESFVCVVSTHSLVSEYCAVEFRHAQQRGKRIVPIACDAADPQAASPGLRQLNWIWCREGDDKEAAFAKLSSALDTDLEWARAHTRLLVRAVDWETRGDNSLLLRGRDLANAERDLAANAGKEPSPTELQQRYVFASRRASTRRQRALLGGVLGALAVSLALGTVAFLQRNTANDRTRVARSQALAAQALRVQELDPRLSLTLARRAEQTSATPQAEEAIRTGLVASPLPVALVASGPTTYGVDFSPDGRFVATAGQGGVRVQLLSGRVVARPIRQKLVYSARFSSDGRFLVTAGADGAVRLWRTRDWRGLPGSARVRPGLLARAAFSRDGRYLVAGGHPGWSNRVWRFADGRIGRRLPVRSGVAGWIDPDGTARVVDRRTAAWTARVTESEPFSYASTVDARLLVATPGYEATRVFGTAKQRLVKALPDSDVAVFESDGLRLATESGGRTVIWDVARFRPAAVVAGTLGGGTFSPDGTLLVGVGRSATRPVARVWDARSGALVAELPPRPPRFHRPVDLPDPYPGPPSPPSSASAGAGVAGPTPAFELRPAASFSPNGDLVATWGWEGRGAQLWQPLGTRLLAVLRTTARSNGVPLELPVAISSNGSLVATADLANKIEVWSTRSSRKISTLVGSTGFVSSLAFDPGGELLAAGSFDHSVRLWRVADGRLLHTFEGHEGRVGGVAFSPNGKLVASASEDGTARVWNALTGEKARLIPVGEGTVNAVSFSPNGRMLVTAGGDGTARVWSPGTGLELDTLRPTGTVTSVLQASFSPDGRFVATLDRAGDARIWLRSGGGPIRVLKNVGSIAFSPNTEELIVGGGDATARTLRNDDGVETGVLRGHTNNVSAARYNSAGDLIVTAGLDGSARVWEAASHGTVVVLRPSRSPVVAAMLVADGRLVTVSEDGVRLYSCEPCLTPAQLQAAATRRLRAPADR